VISTRYAPAVAVLVGLALFPTVLHTYVGYTASDGKTSQQVPQQLGGIDGIDTRRDAHWVRQYYHTDDFVERRYATAVTLFVARGFDAKALYHHPELGLAHGVPFSSYEVVDVPSDSGAIALHVLKGPDDYACYALLYGDRFVAAPLRFEVRRAVNMLFSPARAMTLFFGQGPASVETRGSAVTRTVVAAVESFRQPAPKAAP
jgi:hypothetical protein